MDTETEDKNSHDVRRRFPWLDMSPAALHAKPQEGFEYSISPSTRIFISDEQLRPLATRLAYGLAGAAEFTTPPKILMESKPGTSADAGDIEINLSTPDTGHVEIPIHGRNEHYRIDVTHFIRVTAQNLTAIARALTTLHKAVRVSTTLALPQPLSTHPPTPNVR